MSLPILPNEIKSMPEDKQSGWVQEELHRLKKESRKLIYRQMVISITGFMGLIVISEVLLGLTGLFDLPVRLILYGILIIWWQFTPFTRNQNARMKENRLTIRQLELYQVFLTARMMKKTVKGRS